MAEGKFVTSITCMDGRIQTPIIKWIKENYDVDYVDTITYTEAQSYVMNTAVECSFVPPSGYELSTWNTAANGSGTNYAVGSTKVISANLTIYAQWVTI